MHGSGLAIVVAVASAALLACGNTAATTPNASGGASGVASAGVGASGNGSAAGAGSGEGGALGAGATAGSQAAGRGSGGSAGGASNVSRGGAASGAAGMLQTSGGAVNPTGQLEAPPNCMGGRELSDADECSFEFFCDGQSTFTNCQLEADGTWGCACGTFSTTTKYFEVSGVAGIEACGVAARACKAENTAQGTRTCNRREQTADAKSCTARSTCGRALEVEPGVAVRVVDQYHLECKASSDTQFESGVVYCSCREGALKGQRFALSAPALDVTCNALRDFCADEVAPRFTPPRTCEAATVSALGDGCRTDQKCAETYEVGKGIAFLNRSTANLSCQPNDGKIGCYCLDGGKSFSFDANIDPTHFDECAKLTNACSVDAKLEPSGSMTCKSTYPTSDDDPLNCTDFLDCTRPMKVGSTSITGHGALGIWCQRPTPTGSWTCSCASNATSKKFELGSSGAPSSACASAATRCSNEVEPFFGFDNRSPDPPQPLP